ncbi:MAG: hypothetical protein QF371_09045, partial [Flavobacteriales bacterium]|nr:hypothetical protein [Flavobacteriales bacterium]
MSRGAWTDEGLNTIQVRNFVNHGYLSMHECDNLIKTPYFGFVLVPFYSLLGTHIWVGRALVLSCVLVVLFLFLKHEETQRFGTVLAIIGLLQFHVFHYSHYSLAEMMSIAWILLGIYLQWRSTIKRHWIWIMFSTICFSLAYYTKITFAYAVIIPFMVRYMQFISDRINERTTTKPLLVDWGIQALVTGFFGTAFYLKWYKPNEAVFDMVKANQGTDRYDIADAWSRFSFNLEHFISVDGIAPFVILLPVVVFGLLFYRNLNQHKQMLLFGLLSWFILEIHHVLLVNPPTRYLLPMFISGLSVISFGLSEMTTTGFRRAILWLALILFGGHNLSYYWASLERRTYSISEIQDYLDNYGLHNETVLGVWGTTLAAETGARTIPLWSDFNTKENPITEYQPRLIFS